MPVALYPQREALGEEEPHYEIAGERAETLAALLEGRLRILVTTARAIAGAHAGSPRGLTLGTDASGSRTGGGPIRARSDGGARTLEAMGYARVATVTEVAEFSVRGGIIDVYGFGMAAAGPARMVGRRGLESLRAFDLTTQRSGEALDEITVLPIGGSAVGGRRSGRSRNSGRRRASDAARAAALRHAAAQDTPAADRRRGRRAPGARRRIISRSRGGWARTCPTREELFEAPAAWADG